MFRHTSFAEQGSELNFYRRFYAVKSIRKSRKHISNRQRRSIALINLMWRWETALNTICNVIIKSLNKIKVEVAKKDLQTQNNRNLIGQNMIKPSMDSFGITHTNRSKWVRINFYHFTTLWHQIWSRKADTQSAHTRLLYLHHRSHDWTTTPAVTNTKFVA